MRNLRFFTLILVTISLASCLAVVIDTKGVNSIGLFVGQRLVLKNGAVVYECEKEYNFQSTLGYWFGGFGTRRCLDSKPSSVKQLGEIAANSEGIVTKIQTIETVTRICDLVILNFPGIEGEFVVPCFRFEGVLNIKRRLYKSKEDLASENSSHG